MRFGAALALVLLLVLALVLPGLGAAPLERAEIYFLDVARAMVETGDWLVPRYEGEPFFDKPPLVYWLMAVAFLGLGPETGAARLVPALAALGLVLATAWMGTLLYDRRTALAGAVILSTTLAFLTFARVAMSDMVLALSTTLAVALCLHALAPGRPAFVLPVLGAVLGLGFAAKGPIAILVPGLAFVLLLARSRRRLFAFARGELALGAVLFAALGLGWYVLVSLRLGAAPLAYFFLRENLERFAGGAYDVGRPFWFYAPAYAAGGLPWSLLAPIALWRLLSSGGGDEGPPARFLAGWVALVLVPLSLSRGKIDYYLLPLYPALSLLIGRFLVASPWRRLDRLWIRVSLVVLAASLALVAAHPPAVPRGWLPGPAAQAALFGVVLLTVIAALVAVFRLRSSLVMVALAGGMAASWLVLVAFFLPAFAAAQPNPAIVADVARELRYQPDLRLVTCTDPTRARRDVLFHVRLRTEERCDLWGLAASRVPYLLLIGPEESRSFQTIPHYREVARYTCLPAEVLTLDGLLRLSEPWPLVLAANFATTDPVAVRKHKREYRKAIRRARAAARRAGGDDRKEGPRPHRRKRLLGGGPAALPRR